MDCRLRSTFAAVQLQSDTVSPQDSGSSPDGEGVAVVYNSWLSNVIHSPLLSVSLMGFLDFIVHDVCRFFTVSNLRGLSISARSTFKPLEDNISCNIDFIALQLKQDGASES